MIQLSGLVQEPVEFSGGGECQEGNGDPEIEGGGNLQGEAIQSNEAGECHSRCLDRCAQGGNCEVWIGCGEILGSGAEVSSRGGGLQGEGTRKGSIGAAVECSPVRKPDRNQSKT